MPKKHKTRRQLPKHTKVNGYKVIYRETLKKYYKEYRQKILQSIRLEILAMVIIALIGSIIIGVVAGHLFRSIGIGEGSYSNYENNRILIERVIQEAVEKLNEIDQMIEERGTEKSTEEKIQEQQNDVEQILYELNQYGYRQQEHSIYFMDSQGNNLYSRDGIQKLNIQEIIKNIPYNQPGSEVIEEMHPVILNDEIYYLYAKVVLNKEILVTYTETANILAFVLGGGIFVLMMIRGMAKRIRYIEYLSQCLYEISKGNLDYQIDVEGEDELARVALAISYMEEQIKQQIDERTEAEKTKNELITNVAHDLRTPLTSIIGYMGLVKDKKYQTEEELEKYLEITYTKTEKLKILIEDLFEYTKLSSRSMELSKQNISVSTLINQLVEELLPLAEKKEIEICTNIKAERTIVFVDMMNMTRVFENIIENAIKYSEIKSRVQIIIQEKNDAIYTTVRNRVIDFGDEDLEKMFERFYRTDLSRNSRTGGSGLGLAISKSIVDMHRGKIWSQVDNEILSVTVKLQLV